MSEEREGIFARCADAVKAVGRSIPEVWDADWGPGADPIRREAGGCLSERQQVISFCDLRLTAWRSRLAVSPVCAKHLRMC